MSHIGRFQAYAAAFEDVFKNDDWSVLEPFFTEDAVYETIADAPLGGKHEGRDTLFAELKATLDRFDRRFDTRELELLEGPTEEDGAVWMRWRVTYRIGNAPPLAIDGEETAHFEGDRIRRLEDRFTPETSRSVLAWFGEHESALPPVE